MPTSERNTKKDTLLVIEDEAGLRLLLSKFLEKKGYRVFSTGTGSEALELIEGEHIDMILVDLDLPDIEGFDVLQAVRLEYQANELPVVLLTAQNKSEKVVKGFSLGANDYITKPVEFHVLLARIKHQLAMRVPRDAMENEPFDPENITVGSMLGHYRILELLGKGGMGAVFKARDERLERLVALKTILPHSGVDRELITRFTREAQIIAKLNHSNIIGIFDIEEKPINYFTMRFIDGRPLSELLQAETLTTERSVKVLGRVANALSAAHKEGIIHRDLKPSNIVIDGNWEPYLADFGMAKIIESNQDITKSDGIVGTPGYMAPEQVDPSLGPIDGRSDIFGLGSILYEMLAGRPAFRGVAAHIMWQIVFKEPEPISKLNPNVSAGLEAVCMKAMAKNPEDRFASAMAFEKALKNAS